MSASLKVTAGEIANRLATYHPQDYQGNAMLSVPLSDLDRIVNSTAEIQNAYLNLYDLNGNLIVSSSPFIYNKGILSGQMNPLAYYYMKRLNSVEYFNQEKNRRNRFSEYLLPDPHRQVAGQRLPEHSIL